MNKDDQLISCGSNCLRLVGDRLVVRNRNQELLHRLSSDETVALATCAWAILRSETAQTCFNLPGGNISILAGPDEYVGKSVVIAVRGKKPTCMITLAAGAAGLLTGWLVHYLGPEEFSRRSAGALLGENE